MKNKIAKTKNKCMCIPFFQALGVLVYCLAIGLFITQGNNLFGKLPEIVSVILFLVIFVTSALICGSIVFIYPVSLYLKEKDTKKSVKIIVLTSVWLIVFVLLFLLTLLLQPNLLSL